MARQTADGDGSKSVALVGAGGNIGSHLVDHLGRLPEIGRIVLIDREVYEEGNIQGQNLTSRDVGKPKALVQARRLRSIRPDLHVEPIHAAIEDVPLGRLRCDVILTGLDSLAARQTVNQAAWRLGVPWLDAGVQAGGLLARVGVYVPGRDAVCLECAWDERDRAAVDQTFPCRRGQSAAPTDAPSALGALAASLEALECMKMLRGDTATALIGRQVLIDASHHKQYVTAFRRNPDCGFDHETWHIEALRRHPSEIALQEALDLAGARGNGHGPAVLRVEGEVFVRRLTCQACGGSRRLLRCARRLTRRQRTCPGCGAEMVAGGADKVDRLAADEVRPASCRRSLKALGLCGGDVFSLCDGESDKHYEIVSNGCD